MLRTPLSRDTNEIFNKENNSNYDNQIENVKIDNEGMLVIIKKWIVKILLKDFFMEKDLLLI